MTSPARRPSSFWAYVIIAVAVGATAVYAAVTIIETPGWSSRTVELPGEGIPACYFVNSTAHIDRFCIAVYGTPAGEELNGTFDHGLGTQTSAIALRYGACASACSTSETWVAPDGTGRVVWSFTLSVTLQVLG